jgi:hypothetical protein
MTRPLQFFAMLHPLVEFDLLRGLSPKERWKIKHRSERIARNQLQQVAVTGGFMGLYRGFTFIKG